MNDNKAGYTDITIILDASGSMTAIADATLEGLNRFVEAQRALPGQVALSLVQFNTQRRVSFVAAPIHEVPRLDRDDYKLDGGTALLDAIGLTIDDTGQRLTALAERDRPSKVIIAILTDGYENSSRQFTYAQVSERIAHQQDVYKWEFLFLGANQDAIAEAGKLSIRRDAALTYQASDHGSLAAFDSLSRSVRDSHTRKNASASFDADDHKKQQGGGSKKDRKSSSQADSGAAGAGNV